MYVAGMTDVHALTATVLEVPRDAPLTQSRLVTSSLPDPDPGGVVLAVERFGVSSNNVSYALLGDLLGHWKPFPAAPGWGRVPVWGTARVLAGDPAVASPGTRLAGYLPMATSVAMRATAGPFGIEDTSPERADMLPLYGRMHRIDSGVWNDQHAGVEVTLLPVTPAAALLARDLTEAGVQAVVVSSASSRTALALSRLLRVAGVRTTGLTSTARIATVTGLDAYDQLLPYEQVAALPREASTTYVDIAGDSDITRAVHQRMGNALDRSVGFGGSHLSVTGPTALRPDPALPGPQPVRFSAGARQVELGDELGRAAVEVIEAQAREILLPWFSGWLRVETVTGLDAARNAWERVARGDVDGRTAITIKP